MKAAVLYGQQDIRYEEVDTPGIISNEEILVEVECAGICGSDIPRLLGKGTHYYPIILGHEFSGKVVEIGKSVKSVSIGDRIAGVPLLPCHKCRDCFQGNFALCNNYSFIGSRENGSWAEFVKIPEKNVVKLPPEITFEQGVFFEPLTVALHGLYLMDFKGGTDVAIVGMGTIGLLTLQCVKNLGAKRIIVFDIDDEQLSIAKKYGADICLNPSKEGFKEIIVDETRGRGFKMVVDTAGVQFSQKLCLEIVEKKGHILFISTPTSSLTFSAKEFEQINRKELTIRGSWMSYSSPFPGTEWELAGYYLSENLVRVERLVERIIPLSEVEGVMRELVTFGRVKGKILLKC